MRFPIVILTLLIGFTTVCTAQLPVFHSGDRINFVGNSITMDGRYHQYLELYYLTRFPDQDIRFYNKGISGDDAEGILRRLNSDVLENEPSWCVLMVGVNDVNRELYMPDRQKESGINLKKQEALYHYYQRLDSIIVHLREKAVRVILMTPSIYDQTALIPSENLIGVNDALKQCATRIKELGEKYELPVLDLWPVMEELNRSIQKENPGATIVGRDRVHPGSYGHFFMFTEFLKSQVSSALVSSLSIDAKRSRIEQSVNGDALILSTDARSLHFEWKENSLPFPLVENGFNPDSFYAFTNRFNREIIQIKSLKKGLYKLLIDSVLVGRYSNKELSEGISLSQNSSAPQYQQSNELLTLLRAYWQLEGRVRQAKFVDYRLLPIGVRNVPGFFDVNLKRRTEKILEFLKDRPKSEVDYCRRNFEEYFINKPRVKEIEADAEDIYDKIQHLRKPVKHSYSVVREK